MLWFSVMISQSRLTINQIKLTESQIHELESSLNDVTAQEKLGILQQLVYAYRVKDSSLSRHYGETGLNLAKALKDTQREGDILTEIGKFHNQWNRLDSARLCYFRALDIYQSLKNLTGQGIICNYIGQSFFNEDKLEQAFEYFLKSYGLFKEIQDIERLAITANDLGITNYYLGNYDTSIRFYLESLRLKEKLGNTKSLALTQANLSDVYANLEEYSQALAYLQLAADVTDSEKDPSFISLINCKIGHLYCKLADYQKAEKYLLESMEVSQKIANPISIAFANSNLGFLYCEQKQYLKAREYYRKAWEIYRNLPGAKTGYVESLNALGLVDGRLGNTWLAIAELVEAMSIGQEIHSKPRIKDSYQYLSEIYQSLGKYREAMEYQKKLQAIQDTIMNSEKSKLISALSIQYETERRENEIDHLTVERHYEKRIQRFILIVFGLVMILTIVLYTRYRSKKKANHILWEKNNLINQQKKQLESSHAELQVTLTAKDKLFSIISHDLRGPFNAFLGLTEILYQESETISPDKIKLYSREIYLEAKTQFELLEKILTWSRLQIGKIDYQPEEISLFQTVKTIIFYLKTQADSKDIELINQTAIGSLVLADQNMLQSVLQNLISNAIKFSHPTHSIWVNSSDHEDGLLVSVRDTGTGISQEGLAKIFRIDGNYSTSGTADERGSGMGLVLCREMIERHGGKIWCESKLGDGSTFYFILPIKKIK